MKSSIAKLAILLGACGLLVAFGNTAANAQVSSFSTANYDNRYVCTNAADADFFTAVIKYNPNGAGGYTAGTLVASSDAFLGGAPDTFCNYTLNTTTSAYTISGQGLGFEKLVWTAASSNAAVCPASFVDNTAIALRNLTNSNGIVVDAEFSSGNLLGQLESGHGYCLK